MNQLTFIPVIMQGEQRPLPLGCQIEGHIGNKTKWIIPNRQYQIGIKWRDVEKNKDECDWSGYDLDFEALAEQRITVGIKVVPEWARLWKDYISSPPAPRAFVDLANFIIKIIERYHVDAIELFNEPDVDRDANIQYGEYFGAWCFANDWYSGGLLYGQCLNTIYPIVHNSYPKVRIIAGALVGAIPSSLQFLDGAIHNNLQCDAISFHKYIGVNGDFDAAFEFGNLIHQRTQKPQILSETSVVANIDTKELEQYQQDYLKYLLQHHQNNTINVIQWYSLANNDWMNTDLVRHNKPTLVYEEFSKYF